MLPFGSVYPPFKSYTLSPFRCFCDGSTFTDCFVVHTNGSVVALCIVQVQVQVSATCTDNVDVAGLGLGMLLLYSGPCGIPETLAFRSRYRFRCRCLLCSFSPYVTIILSWL